ncbi:poly [ADP-ribose] polymerase 1 [Cryptomeria japonica]|uniref:poly [ADP-ribose] polymerase 1 n=1 Tax=Cryptomeria japonica TaxID=3369 RepID=UPI0027D9F025|nr:poly [ADP-ribose] polymerase 1 [Cryptomeria japonica]
MANPPKPWKAEYAKSARSSCKACKNTIEKDAFRIAKMVQSQQFDGYMPLWNHAGCIMKKRGQIRTLDDVEGVDLLRWEDQQKLRKYVENLSQGLAPSTGVSAAEDDSNEYVIDNAKSSRATCKKCNEKIAKGEVRIAIMSEPENTKFRGKVPGWHHAKCFLEMCIWTDPMDKMPGWDSLTAEDKEAVQNIAKPYIQDSKKKVGDSLEKVSESSKNSKDGKKKSVPVVGKSKKRKPEESEMLPRKKQSKGSSNNKSKEVDGKLEESSSGNRELERSLEEQSKALWKIKDELQKNVKLAELKEMLIANDQEPSSSEYDLRERCVDGMLFGALKECPICGGGLEYSGGQYRCRGFLSAWSKCTYSTTNPERQKGKWKIPKETNNEYLLQWFKSQSGKKLVRILPPQSISKHSENQDIIGQSQDPNVGFLQLLAVAIVGNLTESRVEWKHRIEAAGGKLLGKLTRDADCLVINEREIDEHKTEVERARNMKIPILRESYLVDSLEKRRRLPMDEYKVEGKENFVKVKVKGRSSVHEESGLQDTGHILEEGKNIYNTTLNMSDLSTGINSYYILQVIENDNKGGCHVFRKWGRVGSNKIGGQKLERMPKSDAVHEFKRLFLEKTGNTWEAWLNKDNFEKQPAKFLPLEIDYGVDESRQKEIATMGSKSKLDPRVIDLMKLLFDLETYRAAMMEFEINTSEMPLGKLSKSNIHKGFEVLTELQNLINHGDIDVSKENLIIDASNRFFTIIPSVHPHVIRDEDELKSKIKMLETLQDIEIASNLISFENIDEDPLDANYKKLRCNISPLPHDSLDYQLVKKYLEKTHAPTHKEWALELEDVFAVDREGEDNAYAKYKNLQNRMLLWHGSRVTNFVGILSQGLRIAPPEAPVTGYMFGKGVYFADLVSKSAQYCFTQKKNPVGLMLLSEVALGEVYELKNAEYIEKLPKGKHSTKGVGRTKPSEKEFVHWRDGVAVPCGRPVPSGVKKSELLYNEYIVYDTAQVRLQFLLKVRFNHK